MILQRRRLFGLLAAPAIVSITGKLQPALLVPPAPKFTIKPRYMIIAPENETLASDIARSPESFASFAEQFRQVVEPGLREHFDAIYDSFDKVFDATKSDRIR